MLFCVQHGSVHIQFQGVHCEIYYPMRWSELKHHSLTVWPIVFGQEKCWRTESASLPSTVTQQSCWWRQFKNTRRSIFCTAQIQRRVPYTTLLHSLPHNHTEYLPSRRPFAGREGGGGQHPGTEQNRGHSASGWRNVMIPGDGWDFFVGFFLYLFVRRESDLFYFSRLRLGPCHLLGLTALIC